VCATIKKSHKDHPLWLFHYQPAILAIHPFGNSMKLILRVGLAAAMQALLMLPASAQWQGAVGLSRRDVTNTEYDKAGRQLVREAGWLPGVALNATYKVGDHTWFAEGEIYNRAIEYHGQTQAGTAVDSRTSTGLTLVRIGGMYALSGNYSVLAAIEWEKWTRDIIGVQGSAGLQEKYQSRRLIAGAQKTWHPAAAGAVSVDAAVVIAEPERLQVGFSGLLDPASLETKRSQGVRIGASIRPSFAPYLELRSRYDWIKIPRSSDVPITLKGQFMGTIAQPEHEKQAITFTVSYIF
jgi:hypothetical protein